MWVFCDLPLRQDSLFFDLHDLNKSRHWNILGSRSKIKERMRIRDQQDGGKPTK
jgi:hypothetical protein